VLLNALNFVKVWSCDLMCGNIWHGWARQDEVRINESENCIFTASPDEFEASSSAYHDLKCPKILTGIMVVINIIILIHLNWTNTSKIGK
jgi:hypothetical protein